MQLLLNVGATDFLRLRISRLDARYLFDPTVITHAKNVGLRLCFPYT